jgi:diacylglycerol kinase family enzyme
VLPGGATNILVRALGLPLDPVEATGRLIEQALAGSTRRIGLWDAPTADPSRSTAAPASTRPRWSASTTSSP